MNATTSSVNWSALTQTSTNKSYALDATLNLSMKLSKSNLRFVKNKLASSLNNLNNNKGKFRTSTFSEDQSSPKRLLARLSLKMLMESPK